MSINILYFLKLKIIENKIKVENGEIWYRVTGEESQMFPIVCLHGGPGFPDRFEILNELTNQRQIITYDQYGAGSSSRESISPDLKIDDFIEELEILAEELKLSKFILLGHSWGGALALEYYKKHPEKIEKLILDSPLISSNQFILDSKNLRRKLPLDIDELMTKLEVEDNTVSNEYKLADYIYNAHYLTRNLDKLDQLYFDEEKINPNYQVYKTLWGDSESNLTGSLKDMDLSYILKNVTIPTLMTCGRFDEVTPESIELFAKQIKDCEVHIFEKSAHSKHLEQSEEFQKVIGDFVNAEN
jgi:proline iminopeptidase